MTKDSWQGLWTHPPRDPLPEEDAVHVWCAELDQEAVVVRAFRDTLALDEQQRADRFNFTKDRAHFIVARGVLRDILGRYLKTPPGCVRFSYSEYGKPLLSEETNDRQLRFNVSHSHGLALFAFTKRRKIGLDIEFMREDFASLEIAEHFFSTREVSALRAFPPELRTAAFFRCWTRKEAYIKAIGEGLSHPLHDFTVSLAPGEPAALLSTETDPQEASRWSLVELFPGTDYAAALAVEGNAPALRCWRWAERR
jgi:4'-phosphopantetheinyl transferase